CVALARQGDDVRVLTTNANGRADTLPAGVVEMSAGPSRGVQVEYARRVAPHTISWRLLEAVPSYVRWADVVHLPAVYSFPSIPTLLAARAYGKPVVISPRGTFGHWGQGRGRWKKKPANLALKLMLNDRTVFHATADSEAIDIQRALGQVRLGVVPNG